MMKTKMIKKARGKVMKIGYSLCAFFVLGHNWVLAQSGNSGSGSLSKARTTLNSNRTEFGQLLDDTAVYFFLIGALIVLGVFLFAREHTQKAVVSFVAAIIFWAIAYGIWG